MSKEVKLHIADGDLVSWRPINNTFAWESHRGSWQLSRDHWNGLLIALGDYNEFKGRKKREPFASVQFMNAGGQCITTLLREGFTGIEILADSAMRSEPVRLGKMSRMPGMKRHSFHPFAWITYWHDWGGYDIEVREHYVASRLTLSYVFTFREVEKIQVVNGMKRQDRDLKDVTEIVVNAVRKGKGPIGDKNDPPPNEP